MTLTTTLKNVFKNKSAPPKALAGGPEAAVAPTLVVRENQICAQLNISKDEVRLRRQYFLTQGQHWDYVNKRVLLSTIGAQILRGTISCPLPADFQKNAAAADSGSRRPPIALLPEKNPPPVEFTGTLLAWQSPNHNHRILIAYLPDTDPTNPMNLVTCFVRSNLHFIRGMQLPGPGRQVKQLDQVRYELLGECPRARGRW